MVGDFTTENKVVAQIVPLDWFITIPGLKERVYAVG